MSTRSARSAPTGSRASRARARCTCALEGGEVADVKLRIYEPPRFFEALLRGRAFTEAPDITARICGICPVAYQMSAVRAMEDACGVTIDEGPIRDLRRLIYCGEWIESHALHVYMLHAPDFLGYSGAVEMARDHREIVEQALRDEEGRQPGARGRRRSRGASDQRPRRRLLPRAAPRRARARWSSRSSGRSRPRCATVAWTAALRSRRSSASPSSSRCATTGATRSTPGGSSRTAASTSRPRQFDEHFVEEHVEHSNALHARLRERGTYLTGPLARYALGVRVAVARRPRGRARRRGWATCAATRSRASSCAPSSSCRRATRRSRSSPPTRSPTRPRSRSTPRRAVGHGATEAPRGMLYHRYEIDEDGTILDARIVPPTSQNQLAIEEDLREVVAAYADLRDDGADDPLRAGDPQPRPVHLLRDALPRARPSNAAEAGAVVLIVGVGNRLRRRRRRRRSRSLERAARRACRPASRCDELEGEPIALLDAWEGARRGRARRRGALGRAGRDDPPRRGRRGRGAAARGARARCVDPRARRRRGDRAGARARPAAPPRRRLRRRGRALRPRRRPLRRRRRRAGALAELVLAEGACAGGEMPVAERER